MKSENSSLSRFSKKNLFLPIFFVEQKKKLTNNNDYVVIVGAFVLLCACTCAAVRRGVVAASVAERRGARALSLSQPAADARYAERARRVSQSDCRDCRNVRRRRALADADSGPLASRTMGRAGLCGACKSIAVLTFAHNSFSFNFGYIFLFVLCMF